MNTTHTTLTAQEQKVFELVGKGLSNKKIGEELQITEKTVKFHLTKVYKKLGVTRYQIISGVPLITAPVAEQTAPEANLP